PRDGTRELRRYWNADRRDNLTTADPEIERAAAAGYHFVGFEGHVRPAIDEPREPARDGIGHVISGLTGGAIGGVVGGLAGASRGLRRRSDRRARRRAGNKVAVVPGGGGAKGCFEAGAAQELFRGGLRPDITGGVSAGAINAAKLAEGRFGSTTEPSSADELV